MYLKSKWQFRTVFFLILQIYWYDYFIILFVINARKRSPNELH